MGETDDRIAAFAASRFAEAERRAEQAEVGRNAVQDRLREVEMLLQTQHTINAAWQKRAYEAEAALAAQAADLEALRRERDMYLSHAKHAAADGASLAAKLDAAEAENARLREALIGIASRDHVRDGERPPLAVALERWNECVAIAKAALSAPPSSGKCPRCGKRVATGKQGDDLCRQCDRTKAAPPSGGKEE